MLFLISHIHSSIPWPLPCPLHSSFTILFSYINFLSTSKKLQLSSVQRSAWMKLSYMSSSVDLYRFIDPPPLHPLFCILIHTLCFSTAFFYWPVSLCNASQVRLLFILFITLHQTLLFDGIFLLTCIASYRLVHTPLHPLLPIHTLCLSFPFHYLSFLNSTTAL